MTRYYNDTHYSGNGLPPHRQSVAVRIVKWVVGIVIALVVVAAALFIGLRIYLSPQHITRLIEEKAGEYLDAEVSLKGMDYSLFRHFPWLKVEVDSLTVVSKSLERLPAGIRDRLPSFSDSLLSVDYMSLKVNIKDLLDKELNLKDIHIEHPTVNLVVADDSTANFMIVPEMPEKMKMPKIKLGEMDVEAPVVLTFFSLHDSTDVKADVDRLTLIKKDKKRLQLDLASTFSGHYREIALPQPVPLQLTATAKGKLPLPEVTIDTLTVSLPGLEVGLSGEISPEKKNIVTVESGALQIKSDDLFAVIEGLPEAIKEKITLPAGLSGTLPFILSCRLNQPYEIDLNSLPEISVASLPAYALEAEIDDASLRLTPAGEKPLYADNLYLHMESAMDPDDPEGAFVKLTGFKMKGEGVDIEADATLSNPFGARQQVEGNVKFSSSLMKTLSYLMPGQLLNLKGHLDGDLTFSGEATELGKEGVKDLKLKGKMASKSLGITTGEGTPPLQLTGMESDFNVYMPKYPTENYQGAFIDLGFTAQEAMAGTINGSFTRLQGVDYHLSVDGSVASGMSPDGDMLLKLKALQARDNGMEFNAKEMSVTSRAHLLTSPKSSSAPYQMKLTAAEQEIESKTAHTPLTLTYQGGGMLQTILNLLDLQADVAIQSGSLTIPSYLYPFSFSNMTFSTDLDRLSAAVGQLKIGRTSLSGSCVMHGVGDFFTSYSPVILKADASLNFSDVDINQLSWGYYGAALKAGNDSVFDVAALKPFTASDSVCVLIPRNIEANINLSAKRAEYMQYSFSPLQTAIIIKDGDATLSRLTVGAPYTTLAVDWTYSTKNLTDIHMDLKADVDKFSFKPFFGVFPQVTAKAAELNNLSGEITAHIDCSFLMYPTMFLNAPSLTAKFDIRGNNLEFARHGRVEHITHLMLIKGDGPIRLANLDITGSFHDNLLQVNPFKISFDDYRLSFGGLNNMQGELYYHLALEKSPFHLPFGVNLEGTFKHPEVRFGGTSTDGKLAEKIAEGLEWNPDVNIMASLKHGWLLFTGEAAKYAQKNE